MPSAEPEGKAVHDPSRQRCLSFVCSARAARPRSRHAPILIAAPLTMPYVQLSAAFHQHCDLDDDLNRSPFSPAPPASVPSRGRAGDNAVIAKEEKMAKLTDTQLIVLSNAATREDGLDANRAERDAAAASAPRAGGFDA
jgi:hypothetical protein